MSEMKEVIRISVRNLVEFILRSGNLDNRRTVSADREAMRKGSKAHRKIQKQMGLSYRAEVPLLWEEEFDEFVVRLEGRKVSAFLYQFSRSSRILSALSQCHPDQSGP